MKVSIDEEKFLINGICDKNNNHKFNNLYFETFERFYLKENIIKKCFICFNILENEYRFECKECKKTYCSICFFSDIHIKKNIENLKVIKINYLEDKDELINNLKNMPTKEQLFNIKSKIQKKSEAFDLLIKSIDEWQKEFNNRIERLKQNLRNEIRIIKKIFFNFNVDYMNNTYYLNFHKFLDSIKDYKNKYLIRFMQSVDFNEKTKNILDIILFKKPEIITYNIKLEKILDTKGYTIIKNLDDKTLLLFSDSLKCFTIFSNKKNENNYDKIYNLNCDNKITSISFSPNKEKIYACAEEKKYIHIINYNPINNILEYSDKFIEINSEGYFQKCIYINSDCILAIDDISIYLFYEDKSNLNRFTNTKKASLKDEIFDICLINENDLLVAQNSSLIFLSVKNLSIEKIINNVECFDTYNVFILIEDCILVNCKEGIAIISIKTKEMIQFIHDSENLVDKEMEKSIDNNIYIFNSSGNLLKFKFFEYNLNLEEKGMNQIDEDEDEDKEKDLSNDDEEELNFNITNLLVNGKEIFLWNEDLYKVIKA